MLKSLNIENIAVIEKADIEFSEGLNVLTGETGAGKSIIVDSINAVLGERTSKDLVRNGAVNGCVTALFDEINSEVKTKLIEFGINIDDDLLIISRKISSAGKSICRINGTPCTVTMLKEIGCHLVNIHGQHDSQALLNSDYHCSFVDMMGEDDSVYQNYKTAFKELLSIRKRLKALTLDADTRDSKLELLDYQINELQAADIKVGEWKSLKDRKAVIDNSQAIISALNYALSAIDGDDNANGAALNLESSSREIERLKSDDDDIKSIITEFGIISNEIEELRDMLTSKLASIDCSSEEIEKIEERLDMYYRFSSKYGATEEDMLEYLNNAIEERISIVNSDEEIDLLNKQYDDALNKTVNLADILSCYRKSLAYRLESDIKSELEYLDMPKTQFIINFEKGNLSLNGYDRVEFLISTNPGEPPKPLSKIASGGELSRIMLAIKNVFAKKDSIATLIFDEIDTGVSGRASRKIGLKLRAVSEHSQVICVTHSAQIASLAHSHYLIKKEFTGERTFTGVESLDYNGRIRELARIMGGLEITDSLKESAKELLCDYYG